MTSLPQFQQQARERFDEKRILNRLVAWCLILQNQQTEFGSLMPGADEEVGRFKEFESEIYSFQDQLLSDFLLEIEKEVVPEQELLPISCSDTTFAFGRGLNKAREELQNVFKRLRGN